MRIVRVVVGVLAILGALSVMLTLAGTLFARCRVMQVSAAAAPDERTIARHVQRECKPDYVPKADLEISFADRDPVSIELGSSTTNRIGLAWDGNDHLTVTVPDEMCPEAFDRTVQGIEVAFRVVPTGALTAPN